MGGGDSAGRTPRRSAGESRAAILAAAERITARRGSGHLSIEAVAAEAGLSKGGVLYHFPSKMRMLEALVELHVARTEEALARHRADAGDAAPNALARALIAAFRERRDATPQNATGLFAALAENPDFIDPARSFQADLVARLRADSDDPDLAVIVFLCMEGLQSLRLFGSECLDDADTEAALRRLSALLDDAG